MLVSASYRLGIEELYTQSVFQYSTGVSLYVDDLDYTFPAVVDISNSKDRGSAIRYQLQAMQFLIPDDFFKSGEPVYLWIHGTDRTVRVVIPVIPCPAPIGMSQTGSSGGNNSGQGGNSGIDDGGNNGNEGGGESGNEGGNTSPSYNYDEDDENLYLLRGSNTLTDPNMEGE